MKIVYINEKIEENYTNHQWLAREFDEEVAKKFEQFRISMALADNIHDARLFNRGMNIEKLRNMDNIWSARLNKKYRVNFKCSEKSPEKITEITITKIHPHDY